jgi:cytidylate kinase
MNHKHSSERLAEAMERARRHWRSQHRAESESLAPARPPWTIAISREAGANGAVVARAVGARLSWPVYDHELIERISSEMGVRADLLESVDEKQRGWLKEDLDRFFTGAAVRQSDYVRHLVETLLSLAAHGICIIVGRGAAQCLPAATTLRIRLVGPRDARVEEVQRRDGLSKEEANRWVDQTDQERNRFIRDHFKKDPGDGALYDLTINSSRFSVDECVELIAETLKRFEARPRVAV